MCGSPSDPIDAVKPLAVELLNVVKGYALTISLCELKELVPIVGSERSVVEDMNGDLFARVLEYRQDRSAAEL